MFSFKSPGAKSPKAPEALFSAADRRWTHFSHRWGGDTPPTSRGPWAGPSWLRWSPARGRDWPAELTGNFRGWSPPSVSDWISSNETTFCGDGCDALVVVLCSLVVAVLRGFPSGPRRQITRREPRFARPWRRESRRVRLGGSDRVPKYLGKREREKSPIRGGARQRGSSAQLQERGVALQSAG